MSKSIIVAVMALLAGAALAPAPAAAQLWDAPRLGEDTGSFALHLGANSSLTEFSDGSTFGTGMAIGGSATIWGWKYVGFRGRVVRSHHEGQHGSVFSPVGAESPMVWFYNGEITLRYPVPRDGISFFPYVGIGGGGKAFQYSTNRFADLAWGRVVGGGIELRPPPSGLLGVVGLMIDLQHYQNLTSFHPNKVERVDGVPREYQFLGIPGANDQTDLMLTIGLTFNY